MTVREMAFPSNSCALVRRNENREEEMNKTLLFALACAVGITGLAETSPSSAATASPTPSSSSPGLRADIRAAATASLRRGDVQEVANRPVHRKRYRTNRPYSLRSIHRPGRWCSRGRWYGKRCYYTPSGLRPFRQR
ncbi:hypothetical protein GCM10008179_07790 [Hansschlegelia plantiphila]|uniref:Uncharacterized protein n=1 Tax=Hansschlegelia plantiphila TaxID=374655 RepID=A0A9W6IXV8_9HYPH|nr:hypothetical protein GCM10008179_07790 [Hansschlegelia plantiphila]